MLLSRDAVVSINIHFYRSMFFKRAMHTKYFPGDQVYKKIYEKVAQCGSAVRIDKFFAGDEV